MIYVAVAAEITVMNNARVNHTQHAAVAHQKKRLPKGQFAS
jgi:hypothetical protein